MKITAWPCSSGGGNPKPKMSTAHSMNKNGIKSKRLSKFFCFFSTFFCFLLILCGEGISLVDMENLRFVWCPYHNTLVFVAGHLLRRATPPYHQ
jgi:hypothetical protein